MSDFPRPEWGLVEQMHAKFSSKVPQNEEGAREWTRMTVEQLKHSYPQGGWCVKSTGPGGIQSKDVAARQIDGRFEGWDLLKAAGVNGPRDIADYPPLFHDLTGQHPIEVTAKNWLETSGGGTGGSTLEARLTNLEQVVNNLRSVLRSV